MCVVGTNTNFGDGREKVGDIHGQLADLVHLMNHNGMPSKTNKYIFNGDFVDRGFQGVEVRAVHVRINPFSTALSIWGQTTWN